MKKMRKIKILKNIINHKVLKLNLVNKKKLNLIILRNYSQLKFKKVK